MTSRPSTAARAPRAAQAALLALAAVILGLAALLTAPAPAAAAPTCWKQLINDWYDGRIDKSYPISCYREALRNLPEDVRTYSSAREDIERALLNAQRGKPPPKPTDLVPPSVARNAPGSKGTDTTPDEPISNGGSGDDNDAGGGDDGTDTTPTETGDVEGAETETITSGDDEAQDEEDAFGVFQPSNAESVPLPLIILAALAFLLLASAAAAFAARRIQARRAGAGPRDPSASP